MCCYSEECTASTERTCVVHNIEGNCLNTGNRRTMQIQYGPLSGWQEQRRIESAWLKMTLCGTEIDPIWRKLYPVFHHQHTLTHRDTHTRTHTHTHPYTHVPSRCIYHPYIPTTDTPYTKTHNTPLYTRTHNLPPLHTVPLWHYCILISNADARTHTYRM
jgi:hypothetical protein